MSEATCVQQASSNWIQQAQSNPMEFLKTLDDLLEDFGPQELGNAATQQFLDKFIDKLRDLINDSDLPQGLKDMANAQLDAHQSRISDDHPCSCEAAEAVSCCAQSDDIDQAAEEAAESSAETATDCCSGSSEPEMSPEAQAEADEEAQNEGTGGSGGAGGAEGSGGGGGSDSMDELNNDQAQQSGDNKKRYSNWLQALAGDLSDIQAKFLDRAMKAKDDMMAETDNAGAGEGKSAAFLDAQAQYTATMQLFTIFSNQTSTSIKSIGEALAGISRKQ